MFISRSFMAYPWSLLPFIVSMLFPSSAVEDVYRVSEDLTSVPQDIDPDVQVLHLTKNRIRTLAAGSFSPYSKLKILYLDGNPLKTIEDGAFDGPRFISKMYLNNCAIESFPTSFGPITTKLRYLKLSNAVENTNVLRGSFLTQFTSLATLLLNANDLLHISDIRLPSNIGTINLESTKLTSFPNLTYLPNLAQIYFKSDSFSVIPQELISGLSNKLTTLQIKDCGLENVPDLTGKNELTKLELNENNLVTVPDLLYFNLTKLSIKGNPMTCDKLMCWRRMWARLKELPSGFDDVICVEPQELRERYLMEINPRSMNCQEDERFSPFFRQYYMRIGDTFRLDWNIDYVVENPFHISRTRSRLECSARCLGMSYCEGFVYKQEVRSPEDNCFLVSEST